jgi:hypothetical protein
MLARVTRFTDYLTRTFGVKGRSEPMSVIPDVFPGLPLIDPTDVEHHWTRDEILWQVPVDIAAGGAGSYARIEIGTRQGYITVIEACSCEPVSTNGGFAVNLATRTITGAPNTFPTRCDARAETASPTPGAVCYAAATAVAVTANLSLFSAIANGTQLFPIGAVIDSDEILTVGATVANQRCIFTIFGYDRLAQDWERE